jgi:hypothetical protein
MGGLFKDDPVVVARQEQQRRGQARMARQDPVTGKQTGMVEAGGLEAVDVLPIGWVRRAAGIGLATGALGMAARKTPTDIIRRHFDEYTASRNAWEDMLQLIHAGRKPTEERAGEMLNILYPMTGDTRLTNLENLKAVARRERKTRSVAETKPSLAEKIGDHDETAWMNRPGVDAPDDASVVMRNQQGIPVRVPTTPYGPLPPFAYTKQTMPLSEADFKATLDNVNDLLAERLKNESYQIQLRKGFAWPSTDMEVYVKGVDPKTKTQFDNWSRAGWISTKLVPPKHSGYIEFGAKNASLLPVNPASLKMQNVAPFGALRNRTSPRWSGDPPLEEQPFIGVSKYSPTKTRPGMAIYESLNDALKSRHRIHVRSGGTGLSVGSYNLWDAMEKQGKAWRFEGSSFGEDFLMKSLPPVGVGLGTGLLQYQRPEEFK